MSTAWHTPAGPLVAAAVLAALFVQAFIRLRRRGRRDHASWTRPVLVAAGLFALVLPLVSPLDQAADHYLLSAHMLQHVLIGDVAPLLLVAATRGPLVVFLLPTPALQRLAAIRGVRTALGALLRPRVAFGLWAAAVLGWHVPAAYDAALTHPVLHDLEHASFVLAGTLAWTQLLDPARRGDLSRVRRIAFAFGLLVVSQPVVTGLLLSQHAVYSPYAAQPHRVLGIGVLSDQRAAAVVMLVEQLLTFGVFIGVQLTALLRGRAAAATAQGTA